MNTYPKSVRFSKIAAAVLLSLSAQAAPPSIVWSPTDHSDMVGIEGAKAYRKSLGGGAYQTCRSDTMQSVGIRTVRFYVDALGSLEGTGRGMLVGLTSARAPINKYVGSDNYGIGFNYDSRILKNSAVVAVSVPYGTGDTVEMETDLDKHTVKFRRVGSPWTAAIDTTSLGNYLYATCSLGNGVTPSTVSITDSNWNDYPWPTIGVTASGDSMTLTGGAERTYHSYLLDMIEANRVGLATGYRFGTNGISWQFGWSASGYNNPVTGAPYTLREDAYLRVDPARAPNLPNWLIAFAGTNGAAIAKHSGATECAHAKAYVSDRISVGWEVGKIILPTMLPRGGVPATVNTEYNACLVAASLTMGFRVARFDLDPDLSVLNSTCYQSDLTHMTDFCQKKAAGVIFNLMQSVGAF